MKGNRNTHRKKKHIAIYIALAVSLLILSELVACSICAPELFQKATMPIQRCWNLVCDAGGDLMGFFTSKEQVDQQSEQDHGPEFEPQIAGKPLLESTMQLADPAVTELKTVNGQEILTGNGRITVYFNQSDEEWASLSYGEDNIGKYGCGPTAMAMVINSMTDYETNPELMAQWAVEHHYWASKSGSYPAIVEGTASAFGLTVKALEEHTPKALESAILSGDILVALMGPGHFTKGGHFIVLRGVTLTGEILVADPNSRDCSLTAWNPQLILDELSDSTAAGAPLWVISQDNAL